MLVPQHLSVQASLFAAEETRRTHAMVCACAELAIAKAAFTTVEPKESEPKQPKKSKRRNRHVRRRYDKMMREKRAEEAALTLFPVPELEPFHV